MPKTEMKYKNLGNTGLRVSRICLGTLDWGRRINDDECAQLLTDAMELGINYLDTADAYGFGLSETSIGKAVKATGTREQLVIATKCQAKMGEGVNDSGLGRKHMIKALEDSLTRLQTDYVDVFYAHNPDPRTPIEETMRTFEDIVRSGKARYIGCSNWTVWQMAKAMKISAVNGTEPFIACEPPYNLLQRDAEVELVPFCIDNGIGISVYSPMASEMLSGNYRKGEEATVGRFAQQDINSQYSKKQYWNDANFDAVEKLIAAAQETGLSMPQFALGWVLQQPGITSAISGPINKEQLTENCGAVNVTIPEEALAVADEVWSVFRPARLHYARDGKLRKI